MPRLPLLLVIGITTSVLGGLPQSTSAQPPTTGTTVPNTLGPGMGGPGSGYGGGECCPCQDDGCNQCGHHNRRRQNDFFNCNCNGSYKFPVPPLYTYHWPGMYSAVRMTDYHSPWRFPPLKPYVDEPGPIPLERPLARSENSSSISPVGHELPVKAERRVIGQAEPMSVKLQRMSSR